jgi:hypothetical protein
MDNQIQKYNSTTAQGNTWVSLLNALLVIGMMALIGFSHLLGSPFNVEVEMEHLSPSALALAHATNGASSFLYEHWKGICEKQNKVWPRGDGVNANMPDNRTWSISAKTFEKRQTHNTCKSLNDLLHAVKYGEREWESIGQAVHHEPRSKEDSIMYQDLQSHFVPKDCEIDFMDEEKACDVLNKYSNIILFGDSLNRHTAQGIDG